MRRSGPAAALAPFLILAGLARALPAAGAEPPRWLPAPMGLLQGELVARYGAGQRGRIQRGLAGFRIPLERLVDARGRHPFPPGRTPLDPWNLREAIQAEYPSGRAGWARQRLLQQVLERIADQTVPAPALARPGADWNPAADPAGPGPDSRYGPWLAIFQAERRIDPWSPRLPTLMARRCAGDGQLPEARVRALLEAVGGSPLAARAARIARARLGRPLEPFDLWYDGFRPRTGLDARARRRYPDLAAFGHDLPRLVQALGFAPDRTAWLGDHLRVEPARDAGHVRGPGGPEDPARLRLRAGPGGLDRAGFSRALHMGGHGLARCFARLRAPSPLLAGLPGPACGEALAFLVQDRDLDLLGQPEPDARGRALAVLDAFWATFAAAGAALVDLDAWHWLYRHPDATPAEFRGAVLAGARAIWNRWYAPLLGSRDRTLLATHGHLVDGRLGLPDYPIGRLMAFQLQRQVGPGGSLGVLFERAASQGHLTPDLWLERVAGVPLDAGPLLEATGSALDQLEGRGPAAAREPPRTTLAPAIGISNGGPVPANWWDDKKLLRRPRT